MIWRIHTPSELGQFPKLSSSSIATCISFAAVVVSGAFVEGFIAPVSVGGGAFLAENDLAKVLSLRFMVLLSLAMIPAFGIDF